MNLAGKLGPSVKHRSSFMSNRDCTLRCKNIWKVFGDDSGKIFAAHSNAPSPETLKEAGLIAAVKEASFDIYQGEIFVIMGLSGSGKSTLVRCLSRLIEPTSGSILFNGEDLLSMNEKSLIEIRRHKMGMVFQHFALLPHLSVLQNVAFPLSVQGISRSEREKRAFEMINLVGLAGRENYYPHELSGGQQQRVGIARSLAVEPEVWFLDEPFSALDPLIRKEMQDEFLRLQDVLNKTIVFITHDFDEAIRLADRVAIMQDGAVVQIGTPEELVLNPATDYVAEFTQQISRAKVLTAKSIMTSEEPAEYTHSIDSHARVEDFAKSVIYSDTQTAVTNSDGKIIGCIDKAAVLKVLLYQGDQ